jgi:tetratricopeptide (TPR) repeat protein
MPIPVSDAAPGMAERLARRAPALLAVVILAVYWNSFASGFHFDDWHVIEQNPAIRTLANVPRFFIDPHLTTVLRENTDLRPILLASFALNWAISGAAVWSYHVVNLALHWLAALLVFRIVRDHLWLGEDAVVVALAAALIVAVHPLNTEPVNYISARSALLTTVFYLGAFDAAVRGRRIGAGALFTLALLTKAIAVTLPIVLLSYRALARRRVTSTAEVGFLAAGVSDVRFRSAAPVDLLPWRFLVTLGLVAAAGLLYRVWLLPAWVQAATHDASVTPWIYCMTEWSAYLYYLRLFLWPDALVIDRLDYPLARSILAPQAWGSLLTLGGLGVLAWRVRDRWPIVPFAMLWYVITLAPESSVFPLAEPVNEHRPYLAMLGLGALAGLALTRIAAALARAVRGEAGRVSVVVMTLATVLLAGATIGRNETWRDDYTLWRDATEKAPQNPRAWLNAGHAAMGLGEDDLARSYLTAGLRLAPCYAYIQMNLSVLDARARRFEESLRWADEAVRCNPRLALTAYYRGAALERLGRLQEALSDYRAATVVDEHYADAWFAQGNLLEHDTAWAEAAFAYDRAYEENPTLSEAAMRAALLSHYRLGNVARAIEGYRAVLALVPTHYGAHYQLAMALLAGGREDEARAAWRAFEPLAEAIGDKTSIASAPKALLMP